MGNEERVRVEQLDHVELIVPDRDEAAEWYERVLGLEICHEYQQWADRDGGPVMISGDGGKTKLAVFEGQNDQPHESGGHGYHRVAFRVDGASFLQFVTRIEELPITDDDGRKVGLDDVVDHELAFSIYFSDPYGNRLEVTTYDYETTAVALEAEKTASA